MNLPLLDKLLMTAATVVVVLVGVETFVRALEDDRVPIEIANVETLNSPLRAGDDLVVRVTRKKLRSCPISSYRKLVDADGRTYPLSGAASEAGGELSAEFVDLAYPIPPFVPDGEYSLRVRLIYHCKDRDHVITQPDAYFRVVN